MNTVENSSPVTAEDVLSFMSERIKELSSKVPGYVTIEVEAIKSYGISVLFRAYGEHVGHSAETADPLMAIEELARISKGRSEIELLRENAAEMIARAERMEKGGSA